MRRSVYYKLAEKSRLACIAAVETYNRASTPYREEVFSMLMINSWELLLKARIIQENKGSLKSIYEQRNKKKKDGNPSKIKEIKKTRSGNPLTFGLEKCIDLVSSYKKNNIDASCAGNISSLVEIRDLSTHFILNDPVLSKKLAEISLASVRNYVIAATSWFDLSFSDLNISSIPMSFSLDSKNLDAVAKQRPETVTRFLKHIQDVESKNIGVNSDYSVTVSVNFDLLRKKTADAVKVNVVPDKADLTISLDDDRIPPGFDWDYKQLTEKLQTRYGNFKQNTEYHKIRQPLERDKKFCRERWLDTHKKSSGVKRYYNPNIIREFDKHYTTRSATLFDTDANSVNTVAPAGVPLSQEAKKP